MKTLLLSAALASSAAAIFAAPEAYTVDPSHSQVAFSYNHAGYSTTYGLFSGFEGQIVFDQEDPASSSVSVSIGTEKMLTGWTDRDDQFLKSGDFFKTADHPTVTFASTSIEVTGEKTAFISGDLTLNGVTKEVVLDATLNAVVDAYPFPPFAGKKAAGFSATTTLLRSEFGLGLFAPFVGDEIELRISIEAMKLN
jgi:polyisoprenoid-binding protein YceI